MLIDLTAFLESISTAVGVVEGEILKVAPFHEKRVALMSNKMAQNLPIDDETRFAFVQAALLHDCALGEYLADELTDNGKEKKEMNMSAHCIRGEEMLSKLPFYHLVEGAVLYHHERADGLGALGKTADETPFLGQVIHIADMADVLNDLENLTEEGFIIMKEKMKSQVGVMVTEEVFELFDKSIDYEFISYLKSHNLNQSLAEILPESIQDISLDLLKEMATLFGEITDYKSNFTFKHSSGVAEKAYYMGKFYGFEQERCDKLYIAGALHDVGKLLIGNEILEKPDKLTADEYSEMQGHALETWKLISGIKGFEEISKWAAHHHEKLNGRGYPFRLKGDVLGKEERIMACIDIYQALVEDRPYKKGMTHERTMSILNDMAESNELDAEIVRDLETCFGPGGSYRGN